MSLSNWRSYGWLIEHQPTASEIRDLLVVIDRDLADCRIRLEKAAAASVTASLIREPSRETVAEREPPGR